MLTWILAFVRRLRRPPHGEAHSPLLLGLDLPWTSLDPAGRERELRQMSCLAGIPPMKREVYLLSVIDRMELSEISSRLGISKRLAHRYLLDVVIAMEQAASEEP